MNLSNNLIYVITSIAMGFVAWVALIFLAYMTENLETIHRIILLLGGSSQGYIQFLCYIAFFYAIIKMLSMQRLFKKEFEGFGLNLLPDQEQLVLNPEQVAEVKLSILDMEKRGFKYRISDFIKKACTQYRNDNSVSETLQVLDVQIENDKEELEGNLNMVRYLIGAIMSLGFIGTLLGLSRAIGNAHLAKTEEGMSLLTSFLNVAFDTTLVALVLGLVLNYFYHSFIEDIDKFYAKSRTYIVDNLVSRIFASAA